MTHRFPRRLVAVVLAGSLLGAAACSDDDDPDDSAETTTTSGGGSTALAEEAPEAVATTYADVVFSSYADVTTSAEALQDEHRRLRGRAPPTTTLEAAKQAWLDGRLLYGPTEAFRFYDGPIDNPEDGPEGQINAWPLDEAYIDYVDGDAEAGIVNDVAGVPEITTEVLVAANEEGGETNISTGWHAIEFLLWGQDLSDGRPRRPPCHRLHHGRQRRSAGHLPLAPGPAAGRRPHRRARPVGSRGRRLPRRVPRRSRPGHRQHLPEHGRPVAGRAGR